MFIQIMQGKCTRQEEMRGALDRWRQECEPGAVGWLGGTYGFTEEDQFVAVVRFESKEAAAANSERKEQGEWWADAEKLFDGPVEFHNCNKVTMMLDGGSDEAGFVQVMRGKVTDTDRLASMTEEMTNLLHKERPDIIGSTLAIEDDGTFTETVAFTDEAAARAGESKEMPAELREPWEGMVSDLSYLDLHHPWFASHK